MKSSERKEACAEDKCVAPVLCGFCECNSQRDTPEAVPELIAYMVSIIRVSQEHQAQHGHNTMQHLEGRQRRLDRGSGLKLTDLSTLLASQRKLRSH